MILPVTDNGVRPAGNPNFCFYCGLAKGQHAADCVCRKRTVVVELTIPYVVAIPTSWDVHMIEFHRNESSHCLDNDLDALGSWAREDNAVCSCGSGRVKFLREATTEDEVTLPYCKESEKENV